MEAEEVHPIDSLEESHDHGIPGGLPDPRIWDFGLHRRPLRSARALLSAGTGAWICRSVQDHLSTQSFSMWKMCQLAKPGVRTIAVPNNP